MQRFVLLISTSWRCNEFPDPECSMTTPIPKPLVSTRLQSIDALRGLIILFMLLDHVRETFLLHLQVSDPMDVTSTPPDLASPISLSSGQRTLSTMSAP